MISRIEDVMESLDSSRIGPKVFWEEKIGIDFDVIKRIVDGGVVSGQMLGQQVDHGYVAALMQTGAALVLAGLKAAQQPSVSI